MSGPKRLALFVEGEGDVHAAPVLVRQILTHLNAWDAVFLDNQPPFRVGNVAQLSHDDGAAWGRYLQAAGSRGKLGGVLLLLDGDIASVRREPFCAWRFAARFGEWARTVRAGQVYSVATVFACMEYETWMLACADRLAGLPLPDGRPGLPTGTTPPPGDLERAPRDAKGWLDHCMEEGYKPTRDQEPLTRLLVDHLDTLRERNLRSFRRLEHALAQLVDGIRSGNHVVSPSSPSA